MKGRFSGMLQRSPEGEKRNDLNFAYNRRKADKKLFFHLFKIFLSKSIYIPIKESIMNIVILIK
jgi:hypothetical protein